MFCDASLDKLGRKGLSEEVTYEQNPELGGGLSHMDFWGSTTGRVQGVQRPLPGGAEGWSQAVMAMVKVWSWEETGNLHIT